LKGGICWSSIAAEQGMCLPHCCFVQINRRICGLFKTFQRSNASAGPTRNPSSNLLLPVQLPAAELCFLC
jgi:hypothetical protein